MSEQNRKNQIMDPKVMEDMAIVERQGNVAKSSRDRDADANKERDKNDAQMKKAGEFSQNRRGNKCE